MKSVFFGLLAVSAMAATSAAAAGNQLVNGSFEAGLSGWTLGGVSGDGFPPVVIPYNTSAGYPGGAFGEPIPPDNAATNPGFDPVGDHGVYFVADLAHPQTLSQLVSITSGVNYTFGFDVYLPANGFANVNDATFSATVGGLTFASFSASAQPATTWLHFSSSATAVGSGIGSFDFTYNSFGIPAKDFVIDRVYFSATRDIGVPEPASWAMMLVGFGSLGAVLRRRRADMAAAAA